MWFYAQAFSYREPSLMGFDRAAPVLLLPYVLGEVAEFPRADVLNKYDESCEKRMETLRSGCKR